MKWHQTTHLNFTLVKHNGIIHCEKNQLSMWHPELFFYSEISAIWIKTLPRFLPSERIRWCATDYVFLKCYLNFGWGMRQWIHAGVPHQLTTYNRSNLMILRMAGCRRKNHHRTYRPVMKTDPEHRMPNHRWVANAPNYGCLFLFHPARSNISLFRLSTTAWLPSSKNVIF